jgi:hypothetical protein
MALIAALIIERVLFSMGRCSLMAANTIRLFIGTAEILLVVGRDLKGREP